MSEIESYCVLVNPFEGSVSCSQDTLVMDDFGDEICLLEKSEINQIQKEASLDISD